jgi:3-oxoacyl-[acyl-carrier protein] reductase
MRTLEDKVAIVTGSTGGIGKGVAIRFAALGAQVIVTGRSAERGEEVADAIRHSGGKAIFIGGDICSKGDMDTLAAEVARRCGGIDILVSSAGGLDEVARSPNMRGPFADIDLSRVTAFVGQALAAKLNPVQAAVPFLRARKGGSVVFVTSVGGQVATPGQTGIAAFSGGLLMASKVLARELVRDHIRVNCVCVTVVRDTPSWQAAFEQTGTVSEHHRKQYEKIIDRSPLGVADPQDIGEVVAFFASDQAKHITGTSLSPTGGLTFG